MIQGEKEGLFSLMSLATDQTEANLTCFWKETEELWTSQISATYAEDYSQHPLGKRHFNPWGHQGSSQSTNAAHYSTQTLLWAHNCRMGAGTMRCVQGLRWVHWRGALCFENSRLRLLPPRMNPKLIKQWEGLSDWLLPSRWPQLMNWVRDLPRTAGLCCSEDGHGNLFPFQAITWWELSEQYFGCPWTFPKQSLMLSSIVRYCLCQNDVSVAYKITNSLFNLSCLLAVCLYGLWTRKKAKWLGGLHVDWLSQRDLIRSTLQQEMSYLPSLSLSLHIFKMGIIKIIADNCSVHIKLNK